MTAGAASADATTPDDLLLAYAAGTLLPSAALLVATHLALSPDSRARLRELEAVGGALLETITPEPMSDGALDRMMALLDAEDDRAAPAPRPAPVDAAPVDAGAAGAGAADVPGPLAGCLPASLDQLDWRRVMPGLARYPLDLARLGLEGDSNRIELLRLQPGRSVLRHGHEGLEMTLVLKGAFRDELGRHGPGDLVVAGPELEHRPVADEGEVCYCLVVVGGALRLTGAVGAIIGMFAR